MAYVVMAYVIVARVVLAYELSAYVVMPLLTRRRVLSSFEFAVAV